MPGKRSRWIRLLNGEICPGKIGNPCYRCKKNRKYFDHQCSTDCPLFNQFSQKRVISLENTVNNFSANIAKICDIFLNKCLPEMLVSVWVGLGGKLFGKKDDFYETNFINPRWAHWKANQEKYRIDSKYSMNPPCPKLFTTFQILQAIKVFSIAGLYSCAYGPCKGETKSLHLQCTNALNSFSLCKLLSKRPANSHLFFFFFSVLHHQISFFFF